MPPIDQTILAQAPGQGLTLEPVSGPPLNPVTLAAGKPAAVGRSSQCGVVLPDESVSRRHANLKPISGTWFIEDLGSRHGTYVNAVRLEPMHAAPLKRGDLVGIGPWSFRVRIGSGQGAGHMTTTVDVAAKLERVERMAERELAQMTRNRLNLLIDAAAAVAGASNELALAKTIVESAVKGTGFPRAALLRDAGSSSEVRVLCESGPRGTRVEESRLGLDEQGEDTQRETAPVLPPSGLSYSRSLIAEARKGEVARLTSDQSLSTTESIMRLGIQTALCAPIMMGTSIAGFLYLDARLGEGAPGVPPSGSVGVGSTGDKRPSAVASVQNDAAAFCLALAKMYALALANIGRADLEKRQRELEGDLKAAREAQEMIMPPERGAIGKLSYAVRSKSGRYVAGDLFDVVDLGDGRAAIFLGDVAGKGVGAAILMASVQTHLSVALKANPDPAAAVTAVNQRLGQMALGNRFISLWLGVFDPKNGSVNFVDAGHGYCMVAKADGTSERVMSSAGVPLGVSPEDPYAAEMLKVQAGERVVIFSDGVVEQPDKEGSEDQFGLERTAEALATAREPVADVAALFEAVLKYAGTDALADDTTVASVMMG